MALTKFALLAVAFALLALGGTSSKRHHKASSPAGHQHPLSPPAFDSGREYSFKYDAQVSSGYASWVSTQRAMGRLQAQVAVTFKSGSEAVLRMSECRYGQLNGFPHIEEWNPARIQPMNIFESTGADGAKFNDQLEMPIQFKYEDGLVTKIFFNDNEPTWSKNIKKGVLNMLQVNLKRQQVENDQNQNEMKVEQELRKQSGKSSQSNDDQQKSFTVTETSVEGVCETVYTVSSVKRDEMNVTKSINFDRCQILADTAYGTQVDELLPSFVQQLHQQDRLEEVPISPEWTNRSSLPRQTIDRSTIIRYELVDGARKGGNRCELKRAELLSIYVLKGMEAEDSQAMQTVASAQLELVAIDGESVKDMDKAQDQDQEQEQQKKGSKKGAKKQLNNAELPSTQGEGEALLYNADLESQEKLFFMFGDEQEQDGEKKSEQKKQQKQPFPLNYPDSESRIKRVHECLNAVADANSNEFNSGENRAIKAAEDLDELVQVLRYCTVDELKRIQQDTTPKTEEWFADGLAVAGTRNTLKLLVERIQKGEFKELKVGQLLKVIGRGSGLPAPSDRIADIVLSLCKDEKIQSSKMLKQACWLSFGAIVGELQQQTRRAKKSVRTPITIDEMCPRHKTDLYKQVLIEQLKAASDNDVYEKVIALKAIGNAAIESTADDLVKVFTSRDQSPIVRIHAIDAIRRIMDAPQKCAQIHRLLMAVFQNAAEKPEVRMAAFSRIMTSGKLPQPEIIDQIAFTLANDEENAQVEAYVYSTLKALAKSPVPEDKQRASELMNALQLANVSEEELKHKPRASQYARVPLFSQSNKEGIFLDVQSIFSGSTHGGPSIPMHYSIAMDQLFNGKMEKDKVRLSFCQKDIEQFVKRILDIDSSEEDNNNSNNGESNNGQQDQQQKSMFANAAEQLRSIFNKLSIRGHDNAQSEQGNSPMAIFSLRVNNVDTIVLPIGGKSGSNDQSSGNSLQGLKDLLYSTIGSGSGQVQQPLFTLNGIFTWRGRSGRLPTSTGMELKVTQTSMSYGAMKAEMKMQGHSQLNAKFQPTITTSYIQKMKVWGMPTHGSGVKHIVAIEVKLPIDASIQQLTGSGQQKQIKMSLRIPQQTIRLLALHSLPTTFVTETDAKLRRDLSQGERVKSVANKQLESQQRELHMTIGGKALQMPLNIHGQYHAPRKVSEMKEQVKVLTASENHFHVDFQPIHGQTPQEVTVTFIADLFSAHANTPSASLRPRLQDFQDKFQSQFFGKRSSYSDEGSSSSQGSSSSSSADDDNDRDQEQGPLRKQQMSSFNSYLDKYSAEKAYKHSLKVIAETVGGSKTQRAEMQLEGVCDAKFQTCETRVHVERSAMLEGENAPWTCEAQAHVYYPETVADAEDFDSQQQKQQKFICRAQAEWGAKNQQQQRQSIKVDIQGEPSKAMLQKVQQQQHQLRYEDNQWRQQGQQQSQQQSIMPFVDSYAIVADYRLKPEAQNIFVRYLELLKTKHFWNSESRPIFQGQGGESNNNNKDGVSTGRVSAQIQLEPSCGAQYANVTIRTPGQYVRIESLPMQAKLCPLPLVRSSQTIRPAHSVRQLLSNMGVVQSRGECKLDAGGQLRSFDGASYAAPLSKCYTVLAKDCQGGQTTPRFVVLMKTVHGSNGKQKMIKMITQERIVEAQPHPTEPHQLLVKINGKPFTPAEIERQQRDQSPAASTNVDGIEFSSGYASTKGGKRPSIIIEDSAISVRFNGAAARIQLNGKYKRTQCGLCGNYDADATNDWRKANGQMAADLKSFHQSYALQDLQEQGCTVEDQNAFYSRFGAASNNDQKQTDNNDRKNNSQEDEDERSEEPMEMTKVMEFNHKVCFSLKPVKQCPPGTYAFYYGAQGEYSSQEQPKQSKVAFTCLDRHSLEANRLKQQVRREKVAAGISDYPTSFQEVVTVPERCIQY